MLRPLVWLPEIGALWGALGSLAVPESPIDGKKGLLFHMGDATHGACPEE